MSSSKGRGSKLCKDTQCHDRRLFSSSHDQAKMSHRVNYWQPPYVMASLLQEDIITLPELESKTLAHMLSINRPLLEAAPLSRSMVLRVIDSIPQVLRSCRSARKRTQALKKNFSSCLVLQKFLHLPQDVVVVQVGAHPCCSNLGTSGQTLRH